MCVGLNVVVIMLSPVFGVLLLFRLRLGVNRRMGLSFRTQTLSMSPASTHRRGHWRSQKLIRCKSGNLSGREEISFRVDVGQVADGIVFVIGVAFGCGHIKEM